jgi:hypothetical protein
MEVRGSTDRRSTRAVSPPALRASDSPDAPGASGEPAPKAAGTKLGRRVLLGIVVAILIIAGVVWSLAASAPVAGTATSAASTSISSGADTIIALAIRTSPAGFVPQSSKQPASSSSDWAILQRSDGSEANVTVMVYSSAGASQRYIDTFVSGVRGLPGYTDVTSDLASFQRYGTCYGYGEDVDSIAVINGVCTKGNVFLQVHLVSGVSFSDLEGDLTSVMGALYQSAS